MIRTPDQEIFASIKPCFRLRSSRVQFVEARASIVDYLHAETILTMFNKLLVFQLSVRNNRTISLLWKCCRRIEQVFTWRPQVKFLFFFLSLNSSCIYRCISSLADLNHCRKEVIKKTLFVDDNYLYFLQMKRLSVYSKENPF